jgi:hypothetical protein
MLIGTRCTYFKIGYDKGHCWFYNHVDWSGWRETSKGARDWGDPAGAIATWSM